MDQKCDGTILIEVTGMMRRWIAVLCALGLLLAYCPAIAENPKGESIPTVECVLRSYQYTGREALAADIRANGSPAGIDISPALLPVEDLIWVRGQCPGTDVFCKTNVCGKEVSTAARKLAVSGTKIDDLAAFEEALDCFPVLERAEMCGCGLSNAQMEGLQERHPHVRFVWQIRFGKWTLRTDATAFTTANNNNSPHYKSEDFACLRYCTDLKALDLGHNSIRDLSWLEPLRELRILILADNDIRDISVLAKLEKLEYIELFMNPITDITPLSGLEHLLDLNVSHCRIKDLSPIEKVSTLERLYYSFNDGMTDAEKLRVKEALPNVRCSYTHYYATHDGWRGVHRYFVIKYIFDKGVYVPWDTEVPER